MATTKTIQPTGTTITMPAMTDKPNASVFSTDVDRITDAVNALNSNVTNISKSEEPSERIANLEGLKTYINSVASGMKANGTLPITFIPNFTDSVFSTGARVYGTLMRRSENYFTFIGSDLLGNVISITRNGSPWYIYQLALKQ